MLLLKQSISAWDKDNFTEIFKTEVSHLPHASLPLQQGLTKSSYVSDEIFTPIILNSSANESSICIKAGIFYTGIIAGCSCSDDPTPLDTQNEYCEIMFTINKQSAEAEIKLLSD